MEYITVALKVPKEFDYCLNILLAESKRNGLKKTKAQLVMELAQKGYSQEQKTT